MVFFRSRRAMALGTVSLSACLSVSCQNPSETRGPQPRPAGTIAPTVTYTGSPGRPTPGPGSPSNSGPGQLHFKIKVDRRLIQGFGVQQLSNCAQDLNQIQTTLTLSSEVSAATQTALEQQGITVVNQDGQSTLTFNSSLAEVDQDTLEISYSFADLPQGTAVAQTLVKDQSNAQFGFVDYSVTVDPQGGSTLNVNLNATDNLSSVTSCPQLAAEVEGGVLSGTGGDIIMSTPTPSPTPSPTPTPVIAVAPTLSNISRTSGPPASQVILTGTGFEGTTAVTFGGEPAFEFTVDSDTQITAYSTSLNPVAGTVKVINPAGEAESTQSFTPQIVSNRRIFVSPQGSGDGSSWSQAISLRYGLGTAQPGDELWVQAGTHTPGEAEGNRSHSFVSNPNVKIYGGFSGSETDLSQRDPESQLTILSGDLNGNDDYTDNSIDDLADNTYHVFVGADQVLLEGVTLQGGFANGPNVIDRQGAGLYLNTGALTLKEVRFENNVSAFAGGGIYLNQGQLNLDTVHFENNNAAFLGGGIFSNRNASGTGTQVNFVRNTAKQGGGMANDGSGLDLNGFTFDDNGALYSGGALYNRSGASPLLQNGIFKNNRASNGGAVYTTDPNTQLRLRSVVFENNDADNGGAMYNYNHAAPDLEQVRFTGNLANFWGGALYNYQHASPLLKRTAFNDNAATRGGAMYNRSHSSPRIENSVFHNNIASDGGGGAIYNYNAASPTMVHLTFYNNLASADSGADIFSTLLCEPRLLNSIVWNASSDPVFQDVDREMEILNSTVTDVADVNAIGLSNININPGFVDITTPKGPDGVFMTADDGLRLATNSPSSDFGNSTHATATDILGNPRTGSPDQGAYEGEFDVVQGSLQSEDLVVGSGPGVATGDVLVVNYIGTIQGGSEFNNTYTQGTPYQFTLGTGTVIQGWEQGLQGLQVGGKRRLTIPPHLAYGAQWQGPIPPNSTLIFEIELLSINP